VLCLGTEAEGIRGEEMQEEGQVLLEDYTNLFCPQAGICRKASPPAVYIIHGTLQFPKLVHKR